MTEHSTWRISLAHKIAPTFTANPQVEACFVFGSAALGISGQYSDLELAFIWAQLPSVEELQATAQSGLFRLKQGNRTIFCINRT